MCLYFCACNIIYEILSQKYVQKINEIMIFVISVLVKNTPCTLQITLGVIQLFIVQCTAATVQMRRDSFIFTNSYTLEVLERDNLNFKPKENTIKQLAYLSIVA